ncbi:MAG: hypothetical protein WDM70_10275 [Nitrosomonadales bacterium]
MREISQAAYQIFLKQYIEQNINIFEAVDDLSLNDLAGKSMEFISRKIESGNVKQEQIDELVAIAKSTVKGFIIYQLGSAIISSGVGCGYYDEEGNKNQHGIAAKMNDYLFSFCFNPEKNQSNYERFLDYLLSIFEHTFGDGYNGFSYVPNIGAFTKVLDGERLKAYWKQNRNSILGVDFTLKEKSIRTYNYVATYGKDLSSVYRVLDDYCGFSRK